MSWSSESVATFLSLVLGGVILTTACAPSSVRYDRVERLAFNRAAVRLNLPLLWVADEDASGAVEPGEVASLLFYPEEGRWVEDGRFTTEFATAYERIAEEAARGDADVEGLAPAEAERRRLVRLDIDYGIATLVQNDLRGLPEGHRAFVRHMLKAADLIDTLYARQSGSEALQAQVRQGDLASQSMFRRNWGPRGVAPATERDHRCSAIEGAPAPLVDAYPVSLQERDDMCAVLEAHPRAAALLDPFAVVREQDGELVPVAITDAYASEMGAIASELRAAAHELDDPAEDALRAYLGAAADAFTNNDWASADEAWARMNGRNSRWYLRVAPDEVYWDPCAQKAGFHLTLALVNTESLAWQDRLTPLRQDMENQLAALAGAPYAAREVAFHLPDFIDIVINAGNDRSPLGATIGQSLPNWGPVANEGRGRTVAMSNLYTDADSEAIKRAQAESLFDRETVAEYTDGPLPGLLGTILHEATHNLGPSHEYRVNGKTDTEIFGGGLASTMEELKAQSGALWYVELLRSRGVISDELARQIYTDSMVWAFGHISRGMYTATGQRKAYSQLAAIQVGFLLEQGALRFVPEAAAANGSDLGAFAIDFKRMPQAVEALMRLAGGVKARGDRAAAEELAERFVDGDAVPQELITERMVRHPKASFVYALDI